MIFPAKSMVTHIFVFLPLISWKQKMYCTLLPLPLSLSVWAEPPTAPSIGPGLSFPRFKYRLSCAVLQKHLNLRWQECVQLISSTVAPSSGFLSFFLFLFFFCSTTQSTTGRAGANTLKHNRSRLRGGCPGLPCSLSLFIGVLRVSPAALQPRWQWSSQAVL